MTVLVDTNVLNDFLDGRSEWASWSIRTVADIGARRRLIINPVVYAELSAGFETEAYLDEVLAPFDREDLTWPAAFCAGKAFVKYRRAGGSKTSPLPDFFIGAHALTAGYGLLTRDAARYRTYFPDIELIAPSP